MLARGRRWAAEGTARRIREASRLTQRDVAAVVGVTGGAVCLWEVGKRVPRGVGGLRYAKLLAALVEASAEREGVAVPGYRGQQEAAQ